jgi:hypothetical protein
MKTGAVVILCTFICTFFLGVEGAPIMYRVATVSLPSAHPRAGLFYEGNAIWARDGYVDIFNFGSKDWSTFPHPLYIQRAVPPKATIVKNYLYISFVYEDFGANSPNITRLDLDHPTVTSSISWPNSTIIFSDMIGNNDLVIFLKFGQLYFFNSTSATWRTNQILPLNINRTVVTLQTIGNNTLIAGGILTSTLEYSSAVEMYSRLTNTITIMGNLSKAREGIVTTTFGQYAIFAGGGIFISFGGYCPCYLKGVEEIDIWDSKTNSFLPGVAKFPEGKRGMGVAAVGSYVLFFGGLTSLDIVSTVDAFDILNNQIYSDIYNLYFYFSGTINQAVSNGSVVFPYTKDSIIESELLCNYHFVY